MNKQLIAFGVIIALAVVGFIVKSPPRVHGATPAVPTPAPAAAAAEPAPTASTPPYKLNQDTKAFVAADRKIVEQMPVVPSEARAQMVKPASQAAQERLKASLATLDGARSVLQQSEQCIEQINDAKNAQSQDQFPGQVPPNMRAQIQSACVSMGQQAADAFPALRAEFEEQVVKMVR